MRVLIAHNKYIEPGGEDVVVMAESALLADNGHDVRRHIVSNRDLSGIYGKITVAWQAPYSARSRREMAARIADFNPHLVHVHNFFPILTPSIYDACADAGVPVVQTLHNYRLICPQAMMLRDGKPCETCVSGSPYHAVRYACYRGSRLASLVAAHMVSAHRRRDTWNAKVGRFIALTEFTRDKFIEGGLPAEKIVVKPNFVPDPLADAVPIADEREGAVFVGRLSPEKGVATLLRAWRELSIPLRVIGDGPIMADDVGRCDNPAVAVLGRKTGPDVAKEMRRAAFLIMPSQWYEPFGLVLAEAFACGLPVIASRLAAMAEIVEDGVTGIHFEPGDAKDLAAKVLWAAANPSELRRMGENARRVYENRYTPEANYPQLMRIYDAAVRLGP
jgi:glycosyltransferase involved in cell wall biosynthesis